MLDIQEIEAEKTMNWKHKTNNAMSKRKGTKKNTVVDKVLYRKLTIKHHESHNKAEVNLAF